MPLVGCVRSQTDGHQLWVTTSTRLPWLSIQEYKALGFCNLFRQDDYKWCNHRLIALNVGPSRQHLVLAYAPTRAELVTDLQRLESVGAQFGDQPSSARLHEVISALMSGAPIPPLPTPVPDAPLVHPENEIPAADPQPSVLSVPVGSLGTNPDDLKLKRFFAKNLMRIYRMDIEQLRDFRDRVVPRKIDPELQPMLIPIVNQRLAELTVSHTASLSLDQLLEERKSLLCCHDDNLRLALYQPLLEQTIVQRAREEYAAVDTAEMLWAKKHVLMTSGDPILISLLLPHLNARLLVLFVEYLNWETNPENLTSLEGRIREQNNQLGEFADLFHETTASMLISVFRDRLLHSASPSIPQPPPPAPPMPQPPPPPRPLPRPSPLKPRVRLSVKNIDFENIYGTTGSSDSPPEADDWSDVEEEHVELTPLISTLSNMPFAWGFEAARDRMQCVSFAVYLAQDPSTLAALLIIEPEPRNAVNFRVIAFALFKEEYLASVIDRLSDSLTPIAQSRLPPVDRSQQDATFEFEIAFVVPNSVSDVIGMAFTSLGFTLVPILASSSSVPSSAWFHKKVKTTRQPVSHLAQLVHARLLMRRSSIDPDL